MLSAILIGLLVNAISATGRILAGSVSALSSRRTAGEIDIARWLDTDTITENVPDLPDLTDAAAGKLAQILRGDEAQAVLQALLTARLTDASEVEVARIRAPWEVLFGTEPALPVGLAETLFDFYDEQIGLLVARLEGSDPNALPSIRNDAFATRAVSILGAIERQTAALSGRPGHRTEADFVSRYRRHVADEHGKLQPPDLDRRRKVRIEDIYVDASVFLDPPRRAVPDPNALDRPVLKVRELAGIIDRSVLLGDPGGGKSTAANVLVYQFAADSAGKIPFLVTLRKYAAQDPPEHSVAGYIEDTLERFYQCPSPPGLVDLLLLTGRAMVVFDGLDELLDTSRRADISARVERFCAEYPLAPVLVTSRVVGYDQARLDDGQFRCYRLGGFADEQVGEYARKWFALEPDAEPNEAEAFLAESASVSDLRSNPLMLSLMCILYRGHGSLPRDRAGVYERCANLLFRRWDEHRHIHRELRAGRLVEPALRHLAWWLFTTNDPRAAVTEAHLVTETATFLHNRGFEAEEDARDAAAEFVRFCRERMWVLSVAGTTARGEPLYAFTHRTFLEYFAAYRLASTCDTPEDLARALAPRVARREWQVVGELAIQIKDSGTDLGADRAYRELLMAARDPAASDILSVPLTPSEARGNVLSFLASGLHSVGISPTVTRDLTRAILGYVLDRSDNCAPMEQLLGSCAGYEELVSDEFIARIDAMTGSADPVIRRSGLRFLFDLGTRQMANSLDESGAVGANAAAYWGQWSAAQAEAHLADIMTEAADDGWLRIAALTYGLLSVEQALAMPGGLGVLIQDLPGETGELERASYLVQMGWRILNDDGSAIVLDTTAGRRAIEAFAAVGKYVLRHPPPWITIAAVAEHRAFGWALSPANASIQPDEITYLGIAATVLAATEMGDFSLLVQAERPAETGPIGLLVPYVNLRSRRRAHDAGLPKLPVPEGSRQLFRDWANRKVSCVTVSPP